MKTIVVHGTDQDKVTSRLAEFRENADKRAWQVIHLDKSTIDQLPQALSNSLFDQQTLVLAQEPGVLTTTVVDWLATHEQTPGNFVLYKFGTIPATALKKLSIAKTEVFDLPKTIFTLMGLIQKGNANKLIRLIRGQLSDEPSEFIFALIAKQLRDMYWSSLADGPTYPEWRKAKLVTQAKGLSTLELRLMLAELAQMDFLAKTGQVDILDSLDLFFLKHLN